MGEYPQHTNAQKMLDRLNQELVETHAQGEVEVRLRLVYGPPQSGVHVHRTGADIAQDVGINGAEAVSLNSRLDADGYINISWDRHPGATMRSVVLEHLTDRGLIEIGELPDPQQRFFMGLEAAIRAIREDDRLSQEEKKRGIDWLEEGKQISRPIAIEVIKAIFRGELPPF